MKLLEPIQVGKMTLKNRIMFIKEKYDHCQFIKERADIKSALL